MLKNIIKEGRRDTYKVMIEQAQSPSIKTSNALLFDMNQPTIQTSPITITPANTFLKGQKIVKPVMGKNIVSGVKTFINRTMTPPRKTKEVNP